MTEKIAAQVKLEVGAGKANPSPPVGTALGPHGINIMDFCKAFNEATKDMEPGAPIPVEITIFANKKFTFITKTPPASYFLKKAAGLKKGGSTAGRSVAGQVTRAQLEEIAKAKMQDLNAYDLEAAVKMIAGSARSMGLKVMEK